MPTQGAKKMKNDIILVFTDGACSNNPGGPGGWAATLNFSDRYDIISGYSLKTTNNRMELTAVVEAIKHLKKKGYSNIVINSDSAYVVNAINKRWIYNWASNGWKTKAGSDLANADLWNELYNYITNKVLKIKFVKVAGHTGDTFNELADEEAKKEVEHAKRILSNKIQL